MSTRARRPRERKPHLVSDTQGTVLAAPALLAQAKAKSSRLTLIWGDGRDHGPIVSRAAQAPGLTLEVVSPPTGQKGVHFLSERWIAEQAFACFQQNRRLARYGETTFLVFNRGPAGHSG